MLAIAGLAIAKYINLTIIKLAMVGINTIILYSNMTRAITMVWRIVKYTNKKQE